MPWTMYRSVGKLSAADSTTLRSGRSVSAAARILNRLTEMESAQMTWPAAAPTRGAIFSPVVCGRSIQP